MRKKAPQEFSLEKFKNVVHRTDLREISRYPELCLTTVRIFPDWDPQNAFDWLTLGQARLRPQNERNNDGRWRLEAYLPAGVTDIEHDSAYAIRLPLIGVSFGGIEYQETTLNAWVDPNDDGDDFHVPTPGYNPMKHRKAAPCDSPHCGEDHVMVPEGFYVPPFNAELYKAVRGKRVEISFGVAYPENDEG